MTAGLLEPGWPAPPGVRAVTTTRLGGVSEGPWASFNHGEGTGDAPAAVAANRARLERALGAGIGWLRQVHGTRVVRAGASAAGAEADAVVTDRPGLPCAVLAADCLPVLFCADDGTEVAAAHAGWRGLAAGILEATVSRLATPPERLLAWLGPAISRRHFEVGEDVRAAFLRGSPADAAAFTARAPGKWSADLPELARCRLARLGIGRVFGGERCTFTEPEYFYSYRRDGVTGRMATVIMRVPGRRV